MSASGPLNLLIYLIIIVIFLVVLFWILDRFLFFVAGPIESLGHTPAVSSASALPIVEKAYSDYRFPFYLSLIGF